MEANEARQLTIKNYKSLNYITIEKINEEILKYIEKGEFKCYINMKDYGLNLFNIDNLKQFYKNKGFNVQVFMGIYPYTNIEPKLFISWEL